MRVKMTKALSLLLCLLMLVNMLPVSALASEATPDEPSAQTEQQPAECQHTGGSATCKALAVCDNCKQSYGEYAAHSGGTATCTALAVCETCGEGYGALAEHSYENGVCTVCNGADPDYVPPCEHSGGTATCTALAVCETCGEGYGALAEHSYENGVCTACNGADPDYVPPCEHTGGTATCTAQAVCTVCAAAYGELADHSYDNGVCVCGEVCAHAEYAEGKCTLCGAAQPKVACTCETDDPAYHAPFCALYERTGDACTCEVKCTEENHNIYCEVCYFDGIAACTGGEEDQIPYTTGSCGTGVSYTLDNGVLTISGIGEMRNWGPNSAPWYNDSASINKIVINSGVSSIGRYAFQNCSSLTSVEIPDSVTSIGMYAFYGCSSLTSVTIPAFVTSIGDNAFDGCTGLTSVDIPNSVTSIGDNAFDGCTGLTSVEISDSVTSIGMYAFYGCTGLTSVDIPNFVTSIGDGAFRECSVLESVDIPDSVTSIGNGAFLNCTSLTSVTIPDSVTKIGNGAFDGCNSLRSVTAPCKCTVSGKELRYGEKLLYTFDDGVTISLAPHKAVDTGSCICGYNPIESVTVTGDKTFWVYDPDATATLTANVAPTNLSNTSYVWKAGGETVPNETSSTLTLTGLNAGNYTYTCTVTVDGYNKTSEAFKVSVIAAPTPVDNLTYTGVAQSLLTADTAGGVEIQYAIGDSAIVPTEGWSAEIPTATDAGSYAVWYKVVGNADHNDSAASCLISTIAPKSIAECSVSLSENDFTYCGSAPALNVNAENNGNSLMKGTDYELGSVEKNAGSYTVTVTGIGNYTGSVELSYTIRKSTSRIEFKDFNPTWTYTGEEFPNPMASYLTITGAGYEDVRFTWYKDGETIFGNPIDAGTYKVVAEIPESENTSPSVAHAEKIIVNPREVSGPIITLESSSYEYDGTEIKPTVTVEYDGKVIPASEYTVSYSNNIKAGTATVTITDNDGGNYIVNGSAQFTIEVREIIVRGLRVSDRVYDGTTTAALDYSGVTYENMPSADGFAITKLELAAKFLNADAGENKPVELTFEDLEVSQGFDVYSIAITIPDALTASIQKRPITVTADSLSKTYGEADPELTYRVPDGALLGSDALTGALSRDAGENAGEYAITIGTLANPNYDITFIPGKLTITKADSSCTAPEAVSDLSFNGGNQNLITAGTANGGTMQYRLSQNESFSSAISTGKNAGTYTVYYKVVGDANHNDSTEGSVTVTIAKATATVDEIPVQKHFHDYATANTLDLSQYLPADRSETTYTLDTITGSFFADGTAVTETGSLTYTTKVMEAAATGSIAVNVVMENYRDVTLTVPVELVAVTAQTETRIVKNGLTEVPAGLANTGFNTLEKLKAEQQRVLALRLGQEPQSSIAHYDVKLQFSPDGGKTWVDATEENFPADGLTVTLPYPSGTGKDSHKFVVSHMFTTGNKAGTTETPTVTKTAEGIQFTVTGLSPVSVAWSAIPFDVSIGAVTNGTVYVSPAHTTAGTQVTITVIPKSGYKLSTLTVKDAAGNSYAVSTDNNGKYYFTMPAANVTVTATFSKISTATADPTNPKTGDDFGVIFWSGMMMTSLFGMAVMVLEKKKFYQR